MTEEEFIEHLGFENETALKRYFGRDISFVVVFGKPGEYDANYVTNVEEKDLLPWLEAAVEKMKQ